MHLGKSTISPDFKAELKEYYSNPLRKQKYELPDIFVKQRMNSNKWKFKLMNYMLRFESNSWKNSQKKNPYMSRSVTPPIHSKNDLKQMAQELYSKVKVSETGQSYKVINDNLKSKSFNINDINEIDEKHTHKPFTHKQRKYKLYDPAKICETARNRSSTILSIDRSKSTDRSVNIIKACQDFLTENQEHKEQINSFLNKTELERKNIYVKQKIYDESLYKEFVDINSEAVKNEEKENLIQKQQSNENLRNWMKGEGRMNKFEFMKYDFEINGIKTYKRKHNLKKVAIDIRKLN